jgi:hypothetical protein
MATPTNLPASFTTGQVLTAANMNDIRGAFRILQVVFNYYTTQQFSSSSTFADTGLSLAITPQATSSKVLVIVNQAGCFKAANNTLMKLKLFRGATELCQFEGYGGFTNTTADNGFGSCSTVWLDSPNSTSAVTYKTQFNSNGNNNGTYVQTAGTASTIALLEVSA